MLREDGVNQRLIWGLTFGSVLIFSFFYHSTEQHMWEGAGPCHCSHHILFRVRTGRGDNGRCCGDLRHSGAGQRLGFGHIRTEWYQEVRGSHKLWSLGTLCLLPCNMFLCCVIPVNKSPIRGCKGESDFCLLHNMMGIQMNPTSGTLLSESSAPEAEISCEAGWLVCFLLTV